MFKTDGGREKYEEEKKLKKAEKGRKFNVNILTNKVLAWACWLAISILLVALSFRETGHKKFEAAQIKQSSFRMP